MTLSDFSPGCDVTVCIHEWEKGEQHIKAQVVAVLSDTHVRIRTDDGLVFAVHREDCMPVVHSARKAA